MSTRLSSRRAASMVRYHLVFCPRYRRRIFAIDGVEDRFKTLVHQICEQSSYDIISLDCENDHCHICVATTPAVSPHMVMKTIKRATSGPLRQEFPALSRMPSLWTRNYLASTKRDISADVIDSYIRTQRTRY